ncbi:hypothetical protein DN523_05240 [Burkholderia multivorans]|nr:hypothetical protein DN471_28060 [Burkholderia multivorans]RAA21066.1 hypothetical protein DN470_26060 [Burkholderia multivorans]RAA35283.1 hypothetical protein DN465_10770 [Burkholderia multivorans]RAA39784.1 hypothetical protein DN500_23685 [Burkholderia multivorans]RAA42778.1 hypothetical protein DN530_28605 [Burkholderia multivorans]
MVITSRWRGVRKRGAAAALPSIVEALRDPRRRICAAARLPRAPHGDTALRRRLAKKKAPPGFPGGALSRTLRRTCIAAARLRA